VGERDRERKKGEGGDVRIRVRKNVLKKNSRRKPYRKKDRREREKDGRDLVREDGGVLSCGSGRNDAKGTRSGLDGKGGRNGTGNAGNARNRTESIGPVQNKKKNKTGHVESSGSCRRKRAFRIKETQGKKNSAGGRRGG